MRMKTENNFRLEFECLATPHPYKKDSVLLRTSMKTKYTGREKEDRSFMWLMPVIP